MEAVVVDDSGFIRGVLSDILGEDGIEVVDEARNGAEAVESVVENEPDVVTMDVEMPGMDGIEAVGEIMERHPTPIVMFSSHTEEGSERTFEALEQGAVDFIPKPHGDGPGISSIKEEVTKTVRASAKAEPGDTDAGTRNEPQEYTDTDATGSVVVVGASTGGPGVVESVVGDLSPETGIRVAVVQHMPEIFTERLAKRLDKKTGFDAYEASDGDSLAPGECAVAPGDGHLVFDSHRRDSTRIEIDHGEEVNNVIPSIDVTLNSAARYIEEDAYAVILTGMGTDGARGSDRLKRKGGTVLAQSEETCAVYGIPKAVVENGDADEVLPPGAMAAEVLRRVQGVEA
jgi:two-component system chemotaxis response regulator CheB